MQAGRINKARDALVHNCMGIEAFDTGKAFYRTADEKLQDVSARIVEALPAEQTHFDQLAVLSYVLYCAFYDYAALEDDTRTELRKLVQVLGQLANYLLPAKSPLCGPMNQVYWATRDDLQAHPDWTRGGTLEWLPSVDERARGAA